MTCASDAEYREPETLSDNHHNLVWVQASDLLNRLDRLARKLDAYPEPPDLSTFTAWRYHSKNGRGEYLPVHHVDPIRVEDLIGIDRQWRAFDRNTRQLIHRLPCNHVLLWGARGTGKSSLVKAALNRHAEAGLRIVEMRRSGLLDLATVVDYLADQDSSFLVLLDDLSFEDDDPLARELKALLEGGVQAMPENVRVVATANRRHLMPKRAGENVWSDDDDLHVRDAAEEKASLADRFGLRLSFPVPDEAWFLDVVRSLAYRYGMPETLEALEGKAVAWGRRHGLSGRSARQFVDDFVGRRRLAQIDESSHAGGL